MRSPTTTNTPSPPPSKRADLNRQSACAKHRRDREARKLIEAGVFPCGDYNQNDWIEKAAEVFAAEFIYPEAEFAADFESFRAGIQRIEAEHVVRFRRGPCRSKKVSFTFVVKRLERMGVATKGQFAGVKFQKLEEEIYGLPIYKHRSFIAARQARR